MKHLVLAAALLCGVVLAAAEPVKELKVLTIGNSFTWSLRSFFPQVAESGGVKLKLAFANLGGCPFERHWNNYVKSEKDPSFKPYADGKAKKSMQEILTEDKWDIVTIQQASHYSWKPETFQPFADNLIAAVRKLAPTAEIVIQETWSYNAAHPVLNPGKRSWGVDQTGMYEKLYDAYRGLAQKHNLRVIPTGDAVQLVRKAMGDKLVACEPKDYSKMEKPNAPKTTDIVGNFRWGKDRKTGEEKILMDYIHLNARGQYLQALVWYAELFGKDPEAIAFVPKGISADEAALFKKCAKEAVKNYPQVKR